MAATDLRAQQVYLIVPLIKPDAFPLHISQRGLLLRLAWGGASACGGPLFYEQPGGVKGGGVLVSYVSEVDAE